MGQLVVRYKTSDNPGFRELKLPIGLSRRELKAVEGLAVQEIRLDEKVFVPKRVRRTKKKSTKP